MHFNSKFYAGRCVGAGLKGLSPRPGHIDKEERSEDSGVALDGKAQISWPKGLPMQRKEIGPTDVSTKDLGICSGFPPFRGSIISVHHWPNTYRTLLPQRPIIMILSKPTASITGIAQFVT